MEVESKRAMRVGPESGIYYLEGVSIVASCVIDSSGTSGRLGSGSNLKKPIMELRTPGRGLGNMQGWSWLSKFASQRELERYKWKHENPGSVNIDRELERFNWKHENPGSVNIDNGNRPW